MQVFGTITLLSFCGLGIGLACLWSDERPIRFQSSESRTSEGGPVYNEVSWVREAGRDIWWMRQSHLGPETANHPLKDWDRLAMVIELPAGETPRAVFHQLDPTERDARSLAKPVEYRATCFACHPSGPRVIRPDWNSKSAPISLWDRARLHFWNRRLRSYGPVEPVAMPRLVGATPFRHQESAANEGLLVRACAGCHRGEGPGGRGVLTRQHQGTIRFMVESGVMPPNGHRISPSDRKAIDRFVRGF